ncbi:MAG: sigma-70 family RNA polymerase sigma factor [Nanoarchaeota archaeon]|nr:sigma-70 family RNA polymerase sigma factor [Nanoarchaeota archaeon]
MEPLVLYKDEDVSDFFTAEEEFEFIKRAKEGNLEARSRLVTSNIRFVFDFLKTHNIKDNLLELAQEGAIGLLEAIDEYSLDKINPKTGTPYRFKTYAFYHILKNITRFLGRQKRGIELSQSVKEEIKKLKKVRDKLDKPTNHQLAEFLEWSVSKVEYISVAARSVVELDSALYGDNEDAKYSFEEDLRVERPEILADNNLTSERINLALQTLPKREEKILRERYGIGGVSTRTLEEIAIDLKLSRERVRQIEAKTLRKLENMLGWAVDYEKVLTPQQIAEKTGFSLDSVIVLLENGFFGLKNIRNDPEFSIESIRRTKNYKLILRIIGEDVEKESVGQSKQKLERLAQILGAYKQFSKKKRTKYTQALRLVLEYEFPSFFSGKRKYARKYVWDGIEDIVDKALHLFAMSRNQYHISEPRGTVNYMLRSIRKRYDCSTNQLNARIEELLCRTPKQKLAYNIMSIITFNDRRIDFDNEMDPNEILKKANLSEEERIYLEKYIELKSYKAVSKELSVPLYRIEQSLFIAKSKLRISANEQYEHLFTTNTSDEEQERITLGEYQKVLKTKKDLNSEFFKFDLRRKLKIIWNHICRDNDWTSADDVYRNATKRFLTRKYRFYTIINMFDRSHINALMFINPNYDLRRFTVMGYWNKIKGDVAYSIVANELENEGQLSLNKRLAKKRKLQSLLNTLGATISGFNILYSKNYLRRLTRFGGKHDYSAEEINKYLFISRITKNKKHKFSLEEIRRLDLESLVLLSGIDKKDLNAFKLRIKGHSYENIAKKTRINKDGVLTVLRRARGRLRIALENMYPNHLTAMAGNPYDNDFTKAQDYSSIVEETLRRYHKGELSADYMEIDLRAKFRALTDRLFSIKRIDEHKIYNRISYSKLKAKKLAGYILEYFGGSRKEFFRFIYPGNFEDWTEFRGDWIGIGGVERVISKICQAMLEGDSVHINSKLVKKYNLFSPVRSCFGTITTARKEVWKYLENPKQYLNNWKRRNGK